MYDDASSDSLLTLWDSPTGGTLWQHSTDKYEATALMSDNNYAIRADTNDLPADLRGFRADVKFGADSPPTTSNYGYLSIGAGNNAWYTHYHAYYIRWQDDAKDFTLWECNSGSCVDSTETPDASQVKVDRDEWRTVYFYQHKGYVTFIYDGVTVFNMSDSTVNLDDYSSSSFIFSNQNSNPTYQGNMYVKNVYALVNTTQSSPDLTIEDILPQNESRNNTNLYVQYNVSYNNGTVNCSLIVNETVNQTDATISNTTTNTFNTALAADGNYTYRIACSDTENLTESATYNYIYDTTQPFIVVTYPTDGTYLYPNVTTFDLDIYTTDEYLYKANLTIKNGTGAVMYNQYSGILNNWSRYDWNGTVNYKTWQPGQYLVTIQSTDSHTKKKIREPRTRKKDAERKLIYDFDEFEDINAELWLVSSQELDGFESVKKKDRVSPRYRFKSKNKNVKTYTFRFRCSERIHRVESSAYNAHLVCDKGMKGIWFDADLLNITDAKYKVTRINPRVFEIEIRTKGNTLEFESMGGLNYNEVNLTLHKLLNLTVYVNDTNTGLLLTNFTATADGFSSYADGRNDTTVYVRANMTHLVTGNVTGFTINSGNAIANFTNLAITLTAASSGTNVMIYDEITGNLLANETITLELIGDSTGTFTTTTGSKIISGLPTGDYTIVYSASNYATRSYPYSLNASGVTNLTLYMLPTSSSTDIYAYVYSQTGQSLPGYRIYTYRTIDGVYQLVEISTTNYLGTTDLKGQLNTPLYYWLIYDSNDVAVLTTSETEIYTTTLDFYISTTDVVGDTFRKQSGLIYDEIGFNNITNAFNFTYIDTNNNISNMELVVFKMPENTRFAAASSTATSDTLIASINGNYTNGTTYIAKVYASFSPADYITARSITMPSAKPDFGEAGLLMTAIIHLAVAFVGIFNPAVMLVLMGFAFVITGQFGLHNFDWTIQVSVLLITLVLAYLIRKRA